MKLSQRQLERYSRNILLREVGPAGQRKLLEARILIVGAGGLGSPAALYLAAAGVGRIGIADDDTVELNNLQRQIVHFTGDVGKEKAVSAAEKIKAVNPDVTVDVVKTRLKADTIMEAIAPYDFIIDGSDNFPTKFLINDACYFLQKPFSHAGIVRFYGQVMTYLPGRACYRCLFEKPPPADLVPTCRSAGVLGAVAGIIGTIQASEALKYVLGAGELLSDRLLAVDAAGMDFRIITFRRNPDCPLCGERATITKLVDAERNECRI